MTDHKPFFYRIIAMMALSAAVKSDRTEKIHTLYEMYCREHGLDHKTPPEAHILTDEGFKEMDECWWYHPSGFCICDPRNPYIHPNYRDTRWDLHQTEPAVDGHEERDSLEEILSLFHAKTSTS